MTLRFTDILIAFCVCQVLQPSQHQWKSVRAANILAVHTIHGNSHWHVMRGVLRALTDRGHTVTVFTPIVDGDRDGYTEVDVSGNMSARIGLNESQVTSYRSTRAIMTHIASSGRTNCGIVFNHPRMREILDHHQLRLFDAVVAEAIELDYVSYAATILRVPSIYVVPPPIVTYSERMFFGHVPNPAAVSNLLFQHGVPKTFFDRFVNALQTVYGSWWLWREEQRLRKSNPQPFDTVQLVKPSLIFTNTHFITEPSRPLPPNVVQIGGIHLNPPGSIPKDILEFIDDAPHGVIYFTFGTVISMSSLPENVLNVFRESFSQIPQKVLWKYEGDMKNISKNVMTRKWFPQREILLHPNVKLFISHGGISGVYETVDAGVPVLGFPYIYDQPRNIDNLVNAGMAISMDIDSVNKDTFLKAVLEIVNDEKYRKNAKIASERFKDRPMSPADSVVYWTEYVLRHNGAPHLKSQALNLTWYQYFLVDVISTFLFIAFIVLFIIYRVSKIICKHFLIFVYKRKVKSE